MNGFVFDCDGTLLDSIGAWHEAENALLRISNVTLTKAQRDHLNTLTLEEAGDYFHEKLGIGESPDKVVDAVLTHLLDYYRTRSEAVAGALNFVKDVHEAGAVTCVLSSSPLLFLQTGLERCGFLPYLDHVLSAEELGTTKRETRTYERVCGIMGTQASGTWFFDDSWYALATAQQAGWLTCGIFSSDKCGTHEELAHYSRIVADDFTSLDVRQFL